jgi:hypothetical protein
MDYDVREQLRRMIADPSFHTAHCHNHEPVHLWPDVKQPTRANRKRPVFRICPVCQVEFHLRSATQKTCSRACSHCAMRRAGGAPPQRGNAVRRDGLALDRLHHRVGAIADAQLRSRRRLR